MKKLRPTTGARPRIDVTGYAGQWVALHPQTYAVAGHDKSPKRATEAAQKSGVREPVLFFVSTSDGYFVGGGT